MAIVVSVAPTEPLCQGDILEGVPLFFSGADENPGIDKKINHCLVLSRPCAIAHKPYILVAAITPIQIDFLKAANLDEYSLSKLIAQFKGMRDADGSDAFYIGEIPKLGNARYKARLDFICTVEPLTNRDEWVKKHRIGTLHIDFRRDLHTRLFVAIAKQGFDDNGWYSDADLELLIAHGRAKVSAAQAAKDKITTVILAAQADGSYPKASQGLNPKLETATKTLEAEQKALDELLNEESARKSLSSATPPAEA